ncbi:auxin efflux carrier [Chaetomium fimeti]|uniref:Auxin efflux carrier n=1 Tax=Chaetomium fimeti TaxID=1854472 RepID=A0AAE0H5R5_9PEZI|nr:auxin efflux carrier [Chaetomium fimeti]
MSTGFLPSFIAAVQASVSVLLVLLSGGIAAHLKLIDRVDTKSISKICARIFLPALLITKVGSELHASSAGRYLVIVVWGIIVHIVSFLVGLWGHRVLGMPDFVTPAILINNSTSYPLLLITALEDTGILDSLIVTDETAKQLMERAKAYLLVYSTISNCVTFAVGPRLIDSEHAAEDEDEDDKTRDSQGNRHAHIFAAVPDEEANEETRLLDNHLPNRSPHPRRRSSFSFSLPRESGKPQSTPDHRRPWFMSPQRWNRLSVRVKWWFLFILDFFNTPLLGAIIGAVVGLVPQFHRAFFNNADNGGIFTAWLTSALKSIGGLFVTLPVVVAGITLFCSTKEARDNNESTMNLPLGTTLYILFIRFIAWPAVSISTIYVLAANTSLLGSDPILWFCLMMMPTGPSAMKLITLVQVAEGSKESEKMTVRLLTISYLISPVLSLTVAGSLLASQSAIPS